MTVQRKQRAVDLTFNPGWSNELAASRVIDD